MPVSRPILDLSAYFVHPVDVLFHGTGTKTLGIAITSVNGTHRDRMPDKGLGPGGLHAALARRYEVVTLRGSTGERVFVQNTCSQ